MTAASQESVHFPDITAWMGLWAGERIGIIRTNLKTADEASVDLDEWAGLPALCGKYSEIINIFDK